MGRLEGTAPDDTRPVTAAAGRAPSAPAGSRGTPDGCRHTWHKNGQKASKEGWTAGEKSGKWLEWDAHGVKRKSIFGGKAGRRAREGLRQ